MAEKRECPHCGAPVYATDDVCMSCGKSLVQPKPPAEGRPAAPPSPTTPPPPRRRVESTAPTTARIVGTFGGFWDIFPWIAVLFSVLPYLIRFTSFDPTGMLPGIVLLLSFAFGGLVGLALLAWIIIDVLDQQAGIYWIFIAIFLCHPIGLLLYLLMARE